MGDECAECKDLHERLQRAQDELAGHLETIRRQSGALGKARRENESANGKAREHPQWDRCLRLFGTWQRTTGHARSRFSLKRFQLALPYLETYEDEIIVRAIAGLAFDPMTRQMKNGLGEERFDSWETLFKNDASIERHANRAPVSWKAETLEEHAAQEAKAKGEQI